MASKLLQIPEYNIWLAMKRRCYNSNVKHFDRYGGRGIKISEKWFYSFWEFYKDMGPRPSPDYQIERKDNNKGYCKENCKWATRKEQCRNRSTNTYVIYKNKQVSLAELSELTGIKPATLQYRLSKGYSCEEIIKPVGEYYEFNNESHTLSEWSKILDINYDVLRDRVKNLKWSIEKALTTPILKPKEYKKLGNCNK